MKNGQNKKKLNLGSLGELRGGLVGKQFDKALSTITEDCEDRSRNLTARTVTITVAMTPVEDTDGRVKIEARIRSTVPPHCIAGHEARISKTRDRATGKDIFNAEVGGDPDDVEQLTLEDAGKTDE